MSDDAYRQHLADREAQNYASTRRWNDRPNVSGMIGERELARYFGAEQDLRDFPGGDGGVDLQLLLRLDVERWTTVDAKGSTRGDWLYVLENKIDPATVYVLCHTHEAEDRGDLIGWITGSQMMTIMPAGKWSFSVSYRWPAGCLRPMHLLKAMTVGWRHKQRGMV